MFLLDDLLYIGLGLTMGIGAYAVGSIFEGINEPPIINDFRKRGFENGYK